MNRGKFITFEGNEGVGKSYQVTKLQEFLKSSGIDFIITREPGGTIISEKIRELILDDKNGAMTSECEALLYSASRAELLMDVVEPALACGKLVICDRYIDSSLAYQGKARGLGYDFITKINSFAFEKYMPDFTILLDLTPDLAFKRKGGADKNDRLEQSGMDFHKKVYEGYMEVSKMYSDRIQKIDCSGEREETFAKIIDALKKRHII